MWLERFADIEQTCVVSIKTSSVTNMALSIKNGVWACPEAVTLRIQKLWNLKRTENKKVLLLFSIPGRSVSF